jgi:hypothetical protein
MHGHSQARLLCGADCDPRLRLLIQAIAPALKPRPHPVKRLARIHLDIDASTFLGVALTGVVAQGRPAVSAKACEQQIEVVHLPWYCRRAGGLLDADGLGGERHQLDADLVRELGQRRSALRCRRRAQRARDQLGGRQALLEVELDLDLVADGVPVIEHERHADDIGRERELAHRLLRLVGSGLHQLSERRKAPPQTLHQPLDVLGCGCRQIVVIARAALSDRVEAQRGAVTAHQQQLDAELRSQLAQVLVDLRAPGRQLRRVPIRHAGGAHPLRQQVRISDPVGLEQADAPSERAHAA